MMIAYAAQHARSGFIYGANDRFFRYDVQIANTEFVHHF